MCAGIVLGIWRVECQGYWVLCRALNTPLGVWSGFPVRFRSRFVVLEGKGCADNTPVSNRLHTLCVAG